MVESAMNKTIPSNFDSRTNERSTARPASASARSTNQLETGEGRVRESCKTNPFLPSFTIGRGALRVCRIKSAARQNEKSAAVKDLSPDVNP
jgi:hypothetical protein